MYKDMQIIGLGLQAALFCTRSFFIYIKDNIYGRVLIMQYLYIQTNSAKTRQSSINILFVWTNRCLWTYWRTLSLNPSYTYLYLPHI